jgi:hypothetical protein
MLPMPHIDGYRTPTEHTVPVLPGDGLRKKCTRCEFEKFPEEQFATDVREVDGFAPICKACQAEIDREEHLLEVDSRIRTLDRATLRVLELLGNTPAREIVESPHVISLLQDLTRVWGGTQGFAQHVMGQFVAAAPGGMMRQKCLEMYERVLTRASEAGHTKKPLHAMTDDELQQERDRRLTPSMRKALLLRLSEGDGQTNLPYTGGSSAAG